MPLVDIYFMLMGQRWRPRRRRRFAQRLIVFYGCSQCVCLPGVRLRGRLFAVVKPPNQTDYQSGQPGTGDADILCVCACLCVCVMCVTCEMDFRTSEVQFGGCVLLTI